MKFCQYCGASIDDSAKFCEFCGKSTAVTSPSEPVTFSDGTPVVIKPIVYPPEEPKPTARENKKRGFALAAFILALVAVSSSSSLIYVNWILEIAASILAIVFGIIGLSSKRKVFAIIGISLGALAIIIFACREIFWYFGDYFPYYYEEYQSLFIM